MKKRLKIFRIIFAVLLTLTVAGVVVAVIYEKNGPPDYWGDAFGYLVIAMVAIPIFITELELYWTAKYFFVDTYHTAEKTVCKVICLLLVLGIVVIFLKILLRMRAYFWLSWHILALLPIVHVVDFITDRKARIQQKWIEENRNNTN